MGKQFAFFDIGEAARTLSNTRTETQRRLFNEWYDGQADREGKPYPRKVNRGAALKAFKKKILASEILGCY